MNSFLITKLFYNKSRVIRRPFDVRNKKNIDFGVGLVTGVGCRLEAYPHRSNDSTKLISFGENVQLNDYVHITAMGKVSIGNNVLMASKIYISDCTHGFYNGDHQSSPSQSPIKRDYDIKEVIIGDNVWLGEFVSVLPGVTIGEGVVVGANTVVTKSIPKNCIVVGAPARIVKRYNENSCKWEKTNNKGEFI